MRVEDVDFEGNTVFKDRRLRWSMKETKQSNMITKLMKKDLYDPVKLDEDLDKDVPDSPTAKDHDVLTAAALREFKQNSDAVRVAYSTGSDAHLVGGPRFRPGL